MKFLQCLFVFSLALTSAQAATPPPSQFESFNLAFAKALRGESTEHPAVKEIQKMREFRQAQMALKAQNSPAEIIPNGDGLCRIRNGFRMCFAPAIKDGNVGIHFPDSGTKDFFPKSKNFAGFQKELQAHFTPPKRTSWTHWILPEALAAPVTSAEIRPEDRALFFAARGGWERVNLSIPATASVFQDLRESLAGNVGCSGARATMSFRNGNAVRDLGANRFLVRRNGRDFVVTPTRASDVENCFLDRAYCGNYSRQNNRVIQNRPNYNARLMTDCEVQYRECNYPLPQSFLRVEACSGANCSEARAPTRHEIAALNGTEINQAREVELATRVRAIVPTLNLNDPATFDQQVAILRRNPISTPYFGIENPSSLTGSQLSQLRTLEIDWRNLIAESLTPSPRTLDELQKMTLNAATAGRCCANNDCKRAIFERTGVDFDPNQAPLREANPAR